MDITILNKAASVLQKDANIIFAYIFGSYAKNKTRYNSDLDIALFFRTEPGLYDIGNIVNNLEAELNLRIDLVSLNALHIKNPELAYNIIKDGILISSTDHSLLTVYKKKVFIEYLDQKRMLEMFKQKFINRLQTGRFGER